MVVSDSIYVCSDCRGRVISDRGMFVCSSCGLVVGREYVPSLSSSLDHHKSDEVSSGSLIYLGSGVDLYSSYFHSKFKRLSKLHLHVQYASRNLSQTKLRMLRIFAAVCDRFHLGKSVRLKGVKIFLELTRDLKDVSLINYVAAALFIAVHSMNEVIYLSSKMIFAVFQEMGYRVNLRKIRRIIIESGFRKKPYAPSDYFPFLRKQFLLQEKIRSLVETNYSFDFRSYLDIVFKVADLLVSIISGLKKYQRGFNPYCFAIASLYFADRLFAGFIHKKRVLTMELLWEVTGIARSTIRDYSSKIFHSNKGLFLDVALNLLLELVR